MYSGNLFWILSTSVSNGWLVVFGIGSACRLNSCGRWKFRCWLRGVLFWKPSTFRQSTTIIFQLLNSFSKRCWAFWYRKQYRALPSCCPPVGILFGISDLKAVSCSRPSQYRISCCDRHMPRACPWRLPPSYAWTPSPGAVPIYTHLIPWVM